MIALYLPIWLYTITGLDWTRLTTGLPLKLKVQYYNSILVLFVCIFIMLDQISICLIQYMVNLAY